MAGTKEKEKQRLERKRRKEEKRFSEQLEEKWGGGKTEVFSRISSKEIEIRSKTNEERTRAARLIEDAKGQAAAIKRKATLEDIGKEAYKNIVTEAQEQTEEIENSTADEIVTVKKTGAGNLDEAVDFIVQAVISTQQPVSG